MSVPTRDRFIPLPIDSSPLEPKIWWEQSQSKAHELEKQTKSKLHDDSHRGRRKKYQKKHIPKVVHISHTMKRTSPSRTSTFGGKVQTNRFPTVRPIHTPTQSTPIPTFCPLNEDQLKTFIKSLYSMSLHDQGLKFNVTESNAFFKQVLTSFRLVLEKGHRCLDLSSLQLGPRSLSLLDDFLSKPYTHGFKHRLHSLNLRDNRIGGKGGEWEELDQKDKLELTFMESNTSPTTTTSKITSSLFSTPNTYQGQLSISAAILNAIAVSNVDGIKSTLHLLSTSPNLTEVDLSSNALTPHCISLLIESLPSTHLKILHLSNKRAISNYAYHLSNNQLGHSGSQSFATYLQSDILHADRLQALYLVGVGSAGMQHFIAGMAFNRSIQILDLSSNGLRAELICDLCAALSNACVKKLHLSYNRINATASIGLDMLLSRSKTLMYLDLTGCELGRDGMESIVQGWKQSLDSVNGGTMSLVSLILDQNHDMGQLQGKGMEGFAAAFQANHSILHLSMAGCGLTDGMEMYHMLKANRHITYLNLARNPMGDAGANCISVGLTENRANAILSLNLSECEIGDKGGTAISEMLTQNRTIQELYLAHNSLTNESGELLASACSRSSSMIHTLVLDGNNLMPSLLKAANNMFRHKEFNARSQSVNKCFDTLQQIMVQEKVVQLCVEVFEGDVMGEETVRVPSNITTCFELLSHVPGLCHGMPLYLETEALLEETTPNADIPSLNPPIIVPTNTSTSTSSSSNRIIQSCSLRLSVSSSVARLYADCATLIPGLSVDTIRAIRVPIRAIRQNEDNDGDKDDDSESYSSNGISLYGIDSLLGNELIRLDAAISHFESEKLHSQVNEQQMKLDARTASHHVALVRIAAAAAAAQHLDKSVDNQEEEKNEQTPHLHPLGSPFITHNIPAQGPIPEMEEEESSTEMVEMALKNVLEIALTPGTILRQLTENAGNGHTSVTMSEYHDDITVNDVPESPPPRVRWLDTESMNVSPSIQIIPSPVHSPKHPSLPSHPPPIHHPSTSHPPPFLPSPFPSVKSLMNPHAQYGSSFSLDVARRYGSPCTAPSTQRVPLDVNIRTPKNPNKHDLNVRPSTCPSSLSSSLMRSMHSPIPVTSPLNVKSLRALAQALSPKYKDTDETLISPRRPSTVPIRNHVLSPRHMELHSPIPFTRPSTSPMIGSQNGGDMNMISLMHSRPNTQGGRSNLSHSRHRSLERSTVHSPGRIASHSTALPGLRMAFGVDQRAFQSQAQYGIQGNKFLSTRYSERTSQHL